jgi:hypothetical protein
MALTTAISATLGLTARFRNIWTMIIAQDAYEECSVATATLQLGYSMIIQLAYGKQYDIWKTIAIRRNPRWFRLQGNPKSKLAPSPGERIYP